MAEETGILMDILEEKVQRLGEIPLSSEEHSKATKDVTDLYRTQLEEFKIGLEETTRQAKLDYDYDRLEFEKKRTQEELEMREREADVEMFKSKWETIGRFGGLATVLLGTLGICWFEDRDNVMPRNKLRFLDRIKIW